MFYVVLTASQQELEFNIFAKTEGGTGSGFRSQIFRIRSGVGVKKFRLTSPLFQR